MLYQYVLAEVILCAVVFTAVWLVSMWLDGWDNRRMIKEQKRQAKIWAEHAVEREQRREKWLQDRAIYKEDHPHE